MESFFGMNKGLSILLDAESYDYVRNEGEVFGFNMPIIQGNINNLIIPPKSNFRIKPKSWIAIFAPV